MNVILGVTIPEDLGALSNDDLKALRSALKAAALTAAATATPETVAEIRLANEKRTEVKELLTARAEHDSALETDLAAELAALEADEDDDESDADAESEEEDGDADAEGDGESDEGGEGDGGENAGDAVTASLGSGYTPRVRAGQLGNNDLDPEVQRQRRPNAAPVRRTVGELAEAGHIVAAGGMSDVAAGDSLNVTQLSNLLLERYDDIKGGGTEKIKVARIPSHFDTETQVLGDNPETNLRVVGGRDWRADQAQRAVTAAICAPREPYYGLGASSSTERPMKGSMANYRAPRGGLTVYPTPRLSDIDGGTGIWTRTMDANPSAVKEACAVIPCSESLNYDVYGIYRCMKITNMMNMTYPELVEAFLNRLAALQARLAEVTLLDAMIGSTNTKSVTVEGTTLDASIDLWTTLVNVIAVYRDEERYTTEVLEFRAQRWIRDAVKIGLLRQRRTSGSLKDRLPTDADVDSTLRDLGVEPTWMLDYASTWDTIPAQADGAELSALPTTASFHLTPRGNFRVLDEGNLNIGVANNVVRDEDLIMHNQFMLFFENFEGLIDFGAISYNVDLSNFCPNGAQTADVTAITCPELVSA